jgi:nucleoside-diphosphate-sugar epimerase
VIGKLPKGVTQLVMPETSSQLEARLSGVRPDAVFHLATCFRGRHDIHDIEPLVLANVLLGTQLAEALLSAPPRVFVNVGTAWQRDTSGAYAPAALYGATKQAMEDVLRYYADSGAFAVADVKLFDTYGPQDPRGKIVSQLQRAAENREPLQMSPGEQLIDLLHVDDVVEALRAAAMAARDPWSSWAASSGMPQSIRTLVERFSAAYGSSVQVEWGAIPYRSREMFTPWRAGESVPGWSPRIAFEDGIRSLGPLPRDDVNFEGH